MKEIPCGLNQIEYVNRGMGTTCKNFTGGSHKTGTDAGRQACDSLTETQLSAIEKSNKTRHLSARLQFIRISPKFCMSTK